MILKDISFINPIENIFYDEILFRNAEKGLSGEVLRFWESQVYFIVLGKASNETADINFDNVKKDNIPVLRRCSGGGTVLQGKGCFNYSMVLSKKDKRINDLRPSYSFISDKIISALNRVGVKAEFFPISDIALSDNNKKISGNAQRRGKNFILHHGTLLYDFDLQLIAKYLKMPVDIPEYRRNRQHLDFVSNIKIDLGDFKEALKNEFAICSSENFVSVCEEQKMSMIDQDKLLV